MWEPSTLEDRLLQEHSKSNPGTIYLEVPVRLLSEPGRDRRIDAVLIPQVSTSFLEPQDYSLEKVKEAIKHQRVHLIEAKYALNRSVIGQILVARHLVARAMEPDEITMDVVCVKGNADLEDFCEQESINVYLYSHVEPERSHLESIDDRSSERLDVRRSPDKDRRRAFLTGWTEAVKGNLFESVRERKTHANMGNLFGWIYGDKPQEFRLDTWRRYVEHAELSKQDDEK